MAVGLGAFGNHFEDCQGRFGEFLAVAGAAAYQPTDGSNVPDYQMSEAMFVPELQVLYSLNCDGPFARLARFESKAGAGPSCPWPWSVVAGSGASCAKAGNAPKHRATTTRRRAADEFTLRHHLPTA